MSASAEPRDVLTHVHEWLKQWAHEDGVKLRTRYETHSSWGLDRGRSVINIPPHESDTTLVNVYILAHELGHHRSWRAGAIFDRKLCKRVNDGLPISAADKAAYIDEERRAWALGRELLARAGLDDLGAYDEQAARSLANYEAGIPALG